VSDSPLRLLLVEDEPADARLVELALEETGLPILEVVRATTLSESRVILARSDVDLVLLDLYLPDSSGISTLRSVRAVAPSVAVVVLTAFGSGNLALESLRTGAHEYLSKAQIDTQSLERAIRFAVERAVLVERERRARQEACDATCVRDEVLAIVAHDLRNPLSASALYASLLQRVDLPRDECVAAAGAILTSLRQMDTLIQDLLDVSRLEAGRLGITPAELGPAELVRQAVALMQAATDEEGLMLQVEISEGLPPVNADPDRVLQAFSNLLANAVRFSPAGSTIRVQAEPLGREVLFLVSDTGPGIPLEDQVHLFDRFWQARQKRRGGAGLGLSIAKHLVELHGGRIGVESRPGVGSTFLVLRYPVWVRQRMTG
jgi:signal transduction histidine kinase